MPAQQQAPFYPKQATGQGHSLNRPTMEISNENKELEKILKFTNAELTGNWSKLASLIRIYEQRNWAYAKRFASELLRDKQAVDYIETIRQYPDGKIPVTAKTETLPAMVPQIIPDQKSRSKKNYDRLLKIAPDIELRLLKADMNDVVSGSSQVTGYGDFHLYLFRKGREGYYLALAHYKTNDEAVPDPEMIVYFDIQNQSIEALSFQNKFGYSEVYDDMFERRMVNTAERKAQNIYVGKWLKDLKNQKHRIEWKEEHSTGVLPKGVIDEPIPEIETEQEELQDETEEPETTNSNSKEDFLRLIQALNEKREKTKPSTDQLLKDNYRLLTEIVPDLVKRLMYRHSTGILHYSASPHEQSQYSIVRAREINSTVLQFIIYENKDNETESQGMALIAVDTSKLTALVSILANGFNGQEDFWNEQHELNSQISYNTNLQMKQWLEYLSFDNYTATWDNEPEEGEIPDFEPGNVMLTLAHQREGFTQNDIDWINYHRQGLTITPKRKPESGNLETLISIQASKTGCRICNRGKIHYTGRSNRDTGLQQG